MGKHKLVSKVCRQCMCQQGWSSWDHTAQLSPHNHTSIDLAKDTQPFWMTDVIDSIGKWIWCTVCESVCKQADVCVCVCVSICLPAPECTRSVHGPFCYLAYITSDWLRTFNNAEGPSVSSQSRATCTIQDVLGKQWLDCVMSRDRKTMTFFLGKVTALPMPGDIW